MINIWIDLLTVIPKILHGLDPKFGGFISDCFESNSWTGSLYWMITIQI